MSVDSGEAGQYDFVIVGGGSAGSALANRLSADPSNRVLVLEAGRPDYPWDVFIHMPAALTFPIGSRFYDWRYESEPEPHMHGRRIYHARGKVLGGSSSINGMIFQRGNPLDYERWAADPGMSTWDYAHCLPYFKRMENCLRPRPTTSSAATTARSCSSAGRRPTRCSARSSQAVQEAGYPLTEDVNGYRQEGFAPFDRNVHRGRRWSASQAYLHPVMRRDNLDVVTRALVTRIRFDGNRAVGVEYSRFPSGGRRTVEAGEVILCGGAINSPQLLQLSGVGDAGRAARAGHRRGGRPARRRREPAGPPRGLRPVRVHPAGLHAAVPEVALPARGSARSGCSRAAARGATNHFEGGGFVRSNDDVAYPNLMFHFLPIAVRYDGSAPAGGHGYQVHVGPMYSDARGSVKITSTDPRRHPALRFNYLSTDQDRREWVEAIRVTRDLLNQPAMAPVQRRRDLAGSAGRHGRGDPRLGRPGRRRPRCTRRAPPRWAPASGVRPRPCHDGRARRCAGCGWWTPRRCPT